jgi:hypothetical protein
VTDPPAMQLSGMGVSRQLDAEQPKFRLVRHTSSEIKRPQLCTFAISQINLEADLVSIRWVRDVWE